MSIIEFKNRCSFYVMDPLIMSLNSRMRHPRWTTKDQEEYNVFIKNNSFYLEKNNSRSYYEYYPPPRDTVPAAILIQAAWKGYKVRDPSPTSLYMQLKFKMACY